MKEHHYSVTIKWTGNNGSGTKDYKSYSRSHSITGAEKYSEILASSDPAFRGDSSKYNPEDLFLSSLASCHMLWYLHLCSVNDIVVTSYSDKATGVMEESKSGSGKFTSVTLFPSVSVLDRTMLEKAEQLHELANEHCFIANSCNFNILHKPTTTVE